MISRPVRPFFAIILCLGFIVPALSATEVTAAWENMYRQSKNDEQRLEVLKQITEIQGQDFGPFITDALVAVYASRIESADSYATSVRVALARLLVQQAGRLRVIDAARTLVDVYRDAKEPYLKADAALALAQVHATQYAEILALDLASLNLQPEQGRSTAMEIQAYALVQALERMHSPIGFSPVFLASIGWYSHAGQVRQIAKAALVTMVPDLADQMKSIVNSDTDSAHKLAAIQAASASNSPPASKAAVARVGLAEGLEIYQQGVLATRGLVALRMGAIKALVDAKDQSPDSVVLYRNLIDLKEVSQDELLAVYTALGANASQASVELLVDRLAAYNQRQKSGLNSAADRLLILEIIHSLKSANNPIAKPVLLDAQFSNHDGTVARTAKEVAAGLK